MLELTVYIFGATDSYSIELLRLLHDFGLNGVVVDDYPCDACETHRREMKERQISCDILLLDASFDDEMFGDVDLSFPVLKILKSYPDFKKIDFHDYIIYPFQGTELYCRIINLYNMYKNIQYLQQVNNNFKSYLLNLSHDVYSPAKLIKSQIEYLHLNNKNDSYDTIFESTLSQLASIIDVLVSVPYSSVASDAVAIEEMSEIVNVGLLVKSVATQLNLYATNQGVNVIVCVNFVENAFISSNYIYLWRMVYNLMFNAIKYCLGGGVLKVLLNRIGDTLRLEIEDNGIAMAPPQLAAVQQYLMSDYETNTRFGRGMMVVKFVANSLKAIVNVESELGTGTTFTVDFNNVDFN